MVQQVQTGMIEQLRSRIGRLTGSGRVLTGKTFPFHEPALDEALPWGGLPAGSLHEIVGYAPSITGFLAAYLARVRPGRPILWTTPDQQAYAPGLAAFGLDHRRTPHRLGEHVVAAHGHVLQGLGLEVEDRPVLRAHSRGPHVQQAVA